MAGRVNRFAACYTAPMHEEFRSAVLSFGASDCAVARVFDAPSGLPFAVSIAVRLSDAIVDEIDGKPTYTYFNHYRSVNFLIDQILLRSGMWLQERGARYLTVAASQSRPDSPYEGRYSHKKAACLSGLGALGLSGLFAHKTWGPRVRLGTLFTDWEGLVATFPVSYPSIRLRPECADCGQCAKACPAGAIDALTGFSPRICSEWMKKEYQSIGRGSVCGICMAVCPLCD
jgi:epoxyqueuosine reductase